MTGALQVTVTSVIAPIKSRMETFWYRLTHVRYRKVAVKIQR